MYIGICFTSLLQRFGVFWCKFSFSGWNPEGKAKNMVDTHWKLLNLMTLSSLKSIRPPSEAHFHKPCHVLSRLGGLIFHFATVQTQLCLISLTWEKFLALILTSFSTSCCRWKVSSCSRFSASSLLLLSSSSIWRRARLSRSWRRREKEEGGEGGEREERAFIRNVLICTEHFFYFTARAQLEVHTFMYIFLSTVMVS